MAKTTFPQGLDGKDDVVEVLDNINRKGKDPQISRSCDFLLSCLKPKPKVAPPSLPQSKFVSTVPIKHGFARYCLHPSAKPELVRQCVDGLKERGIDIWIDVVCSNIYFRIFLLLFQQFSNSIYICICIYIYCWCVCVCVLMVQLSNYLHK